MTLAPVDPDRFLAEHWDRRPLLVDREEPGRFDPILSTRDAEHVACATGVRMPAFRLVRDGAQLPPSGYTDDVPWRPGSFTGMARVDRIAAEFEAGATLVLQGLHLHWHAAAVYCRGLEAALGCPVQANAYWTPAAAQGFAVHHDTHDVFVLQVDGHKRWRVYEPVVELPLRDQKWPGEGTDPGPAVMDFVLGPGDTLYLPRGWPHEAETSGEASLHITVGLHPPTRLDALRAALESCADDIEFRRALTADGELPDGLLERLGERLDAADVAARARRRLVSSRRPILPDQLAQVRALADLTAEAEVERRDTVIADLEDATLVFEGKEVAFPPQARAALETLVAADGRLEIAALPGLDDPGRLVLVRRLVREGYLRVV